jgi:hypothetical protein
MTITHYFKNFTQEHAAVATAVAYTLTILFGFDTGVSTNQLFVKVIHNTAVLWGSVYVTFLGQG